MKRNHIPLRAVLVPLCAVNASASVFGDVREMIYDPHQLLISVAEVLGYRSAVP